MKRRIGLAAAAMLAGLGLFTPSPASAHTDHCAGQSTATLSTGLGIPQVHPANTADFSFSAGVGVCSSGGGLLAGGTLTGWCGQSSGTGATTTGHRFAYVSGGTGVVITGEVTGTASATEDTADAGACTTKTANNFNIVSSATLTHATTGCTTTTSPTATGGMLHTMTCT